MTPKYLFVFLEMLFLHLFHGNQIDLFSDHMYKHSLFLINRTSGVLISTTSVKRLLKVKTKVEFRGRFCENYRKVLSFL